MKEGYFGFAMQYADGVEQILHPAPMTWSTGSLHRSGRSPGPEAGIGIVAAPDYQRRGPPSVCSKTAEERAMMFGASLWRTRPSPRRIFPP